METNELRKVLEDNKRTPMTLVCEGMSYRTSESEYLYIAGEMVESADMYGWTHYVADVKDIKEVIIGKGHCL